MKIIFCLSLCAVIGPLTAQFAGDDCTTSHNKQRGICKALKQCPEAIRLYQQGIQITTCSYTSGVQIVCCPYDQPQYYQQYKTPHYQPYQPQAAPPIPQQNFESRIISSRRISAQKCDEYKKLVKTVSLVAGLTAVPKIHEVSADTCEQSTALIVGGTKTKNGEFPHMVAIGYKDLDQIRFFCGGSLISDRFVLTAAHCKVNIKKLPIVRLGDQNIKDSSDGLTGIDVPVQEFIKHEQYSWKTKQNDIALVKLADTVKFNNFLRPACLWQNNYVQVPKAIATGWGYLAYEAGETSDELMKVYLDILDLNTCRNAYDDGALKITNTQICAGVLSGGSDTCQGDSGGPLQIASSDNQCVYNIIGITSFGVGCGNARSPSIYTRVSSYLDWIEFKVWG